MRGVLMVAVTLFSVYYEKYTLVGIIKETVSLKNERTSIFFSKYHTITSESEKKTTECISFYLLYNVSISS
jgi:hypothetical protein